MDFDALMKKKLGGKYNKPSLVESLPQTEDGQDQAKPKNKGQKKATFKPRVTCSQCNFVGIDGKEMDIHRKKHDRSFNCEECQFVAKFRIVLRRHQIKEHNKKCHHCDFSAATSASLKMHSQAEHGGGLLSNSAGFMITGDGSEEDVATNEEIGTNEEIATNEESRSPKKKITKSEYLKRQMEVKLDHKSRKTVLPSFKDSFLTLKKNVANLHRQHGTEAEYIIIVKNNLQLPGGGGKTPSPTGGQFMVYGEGTLLTELLSTGLVFDSRVVMMANEFNMDTKDVNLENDKEP